MEEFAAKYTDMVQEELEGKSYAEEAEYIGALIDNLAIIKKTAEDLAQ